jgi:hypothetical protein
MYLLAQQVMCTTSRMDAQDVSPCTTSNMDVRDVSLCTTSSMDVQGVSLTTDSPVDARGVTISTASNVDVQGVSLSTPAVWTCKVYPFPPCVSVQGVSLSTTSSMNVQGVSLSTCSTAGCFFFHLYPVLNAGTRQCPASDHTGTGMKKIPMPGPARCWNKGTQSNTVVFRYRTELLDTGMPMLAASPWMPMPSYAKNERNLYK